MVVVVGAALLGWGTASVKSCGLLGEDRGWAQPWACAKRGGRGWQSAGQAATRRERRDTALRRHLSPSSGNGSGFGRAGSTPGLRHTAKERGRASPGEAVARAAACAGGRPFRWETGGGRQARPRRGGRLRGEGAFRRAHRGAKQEFAARAPRAKQRGPGQAGPSRPGQGNVGWGGGVPRRKRAGVQRGARGIPGGRTPVGGEAGPNAPGRERSRAPRAARTHRAWRRGRRVRARMPAPRPPRHGVRAKRPRVAVSGYRGRTRVRICCLRIDDPVREQVSRLGCPAREDGEARTEPGERCAFNRWETLALRPAAGRSSMLFRRSFAGAGSTANGLRSRRRRGSRSEGAIRARAPRAAPAAPRIRRVSSRRRWDCSRHPPGQS